MPSLMVGDSSSYIGEGWVGGELYATGAYEAVAAGSLLFEGVASRRISKVVSSAGSLEFLGAATRGILKNFTASGELVFSGTKLLATVRTSSSVWEGEVTSGGVIGSSFIGVWG